MLDLATVRDPTARAWIEAVAEAGLALRVWEITADIRVPVFACLIGGGEDVQPELGFGCHPDPDVALLRAIGEAAQARLTVISGAREDLAAAGYGDRGVRLRERAARAWMARAGTRDCRDAPDCATATLDGDFRAVLAALAAAGYPDAAAVELTRKEIGLPVMRVVVPGLEGPWTPPGGGYVPGPRAQGDRGAGGVSLVVFAGPTLPAPEIAARLDAIVLPPAAQGDVWRAVRRHRPVAIGLIDGLFRATRAVWHREILWALSEGVHVLGAASMGALRAAELHPFGMRGIGRVFEAYVAGELEDDDEVAVEHAPAELGHAPLSAAMVDLRATLAAAEAAGALDHATAERAVARLKATPYPRRSLALLAEAAGADLAAWHVPRKRLDALALLDALAALATAPPFAPAFRFQPTIIWNRFVAAAEAEEAADVLDELRLDPPRWRAACLAAAGRAATQGPPPADLRAALSAFRAARGLLRRDQLARWMAENRLDEAGLIRLLRTDPDGFPPRRPLARCSTRCGRAASSPPCTPPPRRAAA